MKDPNATSTASTSRDHYLDVSKSGLVSIVGGKWTTYRLMAQQTVDKVVEVGKLSPQRSCVTTHVQLIGAQGWTPGYFVNLIRNYKRLDEKSQQSEVLSSEIAQHLSHSYGTRYSIFGSKSQQIELTRFWILQRPTVPCLIQNFHIWKLKLSLL